MCVRCHLCVWTRHQAKHHPDRDVPWDPHFDARSPMEFTPTVSRTPDPPMVMHHVREDHHGQKTPSAPRTPLQSEGCHQKPAQIMVNELSQKLLSLQLHEGTGSQERPSTADGSGLGPDSCRTPETKGMVSSVPLPPPMKLPAAEMPPPRQGTFARTESVQDEGDIPPPPLPVFGEERGSREEVNILISMGSVGHPVNCGLPCKYVRRKGGCTDGAACPKCHQCKWSRDNSAAVSGLVSSFSAGSAGHPDRCGPPCKYVRRKTGCYHGESCSNCHLCQWRRQVQAVEEDDAFAVEPITQILPGGKTTNDALTADESDIPVTLPMSRLWNTSATTVLESKRLVATSDVASTIPDRWPSVGSIGHPNTCAGLGCKYNNKARGCKDGKFCVRCHLCQWSRYAGRIVEAPSQLS